MANNGMVNPLRASTYSGIMASGDTSGWTKDELEALKANEAAERKPVRKAAPVAKKAPDSEIKDYARAKTPAVPSQTSDFTPQTKAYKSPFTADTSYGEDAASDFLNRRQAATPREEQLPSEPQKEFIAAKKGGRVKAMASGGSVKSTASNRADGIAQRGKTRGKYC